MQQMDTNIYNMKYYSRLFKIALVVCCLIQVQMVKSVAQIIIEPEYLSVSDGIQSPTVNHVIQDGYGIIWIATTNGLQKYDGYSLQTFKYVPGVSTSLQDNYVWNLMEDQNHDIWVSTNLGASKYIRERNEFINYNFASIFNFTSTSELSGFRFLIDSQQRLWSTSINIELVQYDPEADTWRFAEFEIPNVTDPVLNGFGSDIIEDPKGGLWFGSHSYGLLHMPKGAKAFKPVLPDSLNRATFLDRPNGITNLFWDSSNTLWISSKNGIYKYKPSNGRMSTIKEFVDQAMSDTWNNWNCIQQDSEGNIWILNNFRGILKFQGISDRYEEVHIPGVIKTVTRGWNLTLTNLTIDNSGIFWFGSRQAGLLKYNPVSQPFSYYEYNEDDPKSISPDGAFGVLASQNKPGFIYIGTRGDGLNILDNKSQEFTKVRFNADNDMFGGSVRSIGETIDGSVYIGTWGDGLIKLDEQYNEVARYSHDPDNQLSLSDNRVRVIKPDNQGNLWIGTNNGLNIFNPDKETFQPVASRLSKSYPDSLIAEANRMLASDQVMTIIDHVPDNQDLSEAIEIETAGTYFVIYVGEGDDTDGPADHGWIENESKDTLWAFSDYDKSYHAGGAVKNRVIIAPITLNPGKYTIRYISDDSHAYGKWNEDEPTRLPLYGIALIKPSGKSQVQSVQSLIDMKRNDWSILGNNINDIEIDDQFVWVASNGLSKIDLTNNKVTYYVHDPDNLNSLASNNILDINRDKKGMIWIATDAGVDKLDPASGNFIHFNEEDGMPTNLAQAILEGDEGDMWIATENGVSHMIMNEVLGKVTFINYNSSDGLGGNTFLYGAADRTPGGRFYFGGDHGLTTFGKIMINDTPPSIIISNLLISNRSVLNMGNESPLKTSLQESESITLSHSQNNLSFEFAALHYANPQKNQYAHMLKGYDQDWSYDNRNFAIYTNLDPGKYELIIRASNAYGIWNETGKSLEIIIQPPWWRTPWAYIAYVIVFSLLLFFFDRIMRRSIRKREQERMRDKELAQAKEIERAFKELKATQAQLIQSEKMASLGELTAGIAHEIQNPLNFVNNFSEVNIELISELKDEIEEGNIEEIKAIATDIEQNETKINHHGNRADGIVKSMLQHSRSSSGQKELTDINSLADEYLRLSYHGLRAKDKSFNADFRMEVEKDLPQIHVVTQDIGRVLLNLINNAFYAVLERGKQGEETYKPSVVVSTQKNDKYIEIRVIDNGKGIPDSEKEKIFQPFFTTKPTGEGTGLGLSMSFDIVTKGHGGRLIVNSSMGEGSEFIIQLPFLDEEN